MNVIAYSVNILDVDNLQRLTNTCVSATLVVLTDHKEARKRKIEHCIAQKGHVVIQYYM